MNDKLKETFNRIHAEEELKDKTKLFLESQKQRRSSRKKTARQRFMPVAACLLFLLLGWSGYRVYFTSSSTISIDVNPSLELGVNRFDKVISVEGYNDDGTELVSLLNVNFMDYTKAIKQILDSESVVDCLSRDEIVSIAVVGSNEEQREKMLSNIRLCTGGAKNMYCYSAAPEEVVAAHEEGLSYGKYRAFLELKKLDTSVTPEKIQQMTMREIHDLIDTLSSGNSGNEETNGHRRGGHPGTGKIGQGNREGAKRN